MNFKEKYFSYIMKNSNSIAEVCGAISVSLIFLIGVGRYRIVIVYAVYSFLASSLFLKNGKIIKPIFFPAVLIALFYDIKSGPIFPILIKNNLLVAMTIMVIADVIARKIANLIVSNAVGGELFAVCPECSFDNKQLMNICSNCNYESHNKTPRKNDDALCKLLRFLSICENEKVIYQKRLTRNIACYKNGERKLRKHLIITKKRVAFVDYGSLFGFTKTIIYRDKDIFEIDSIKSVECKIKNLFMASRPFIVFTLMNNDVYEIAFSSFSNYKKELAEISNIIKSENNQVVITIDLPDMPWR